jgi:multimeric flavodoxin WrbA
MEGDIGMKVLIINGSPHKEGTTYTALSEALRVLTEEGVDAEIVNVGATGYRGCTACGGCRREGGGCVINDGVNEIAQKFEEADGIIVGTPVYYASPNGNLISFLDRLFYSTRFDKSMKVGAAVVCARRGGCTASFDVISKYFTISGMPIASSTYWNQVHGAVAEDALEDAEGLQTMRNLARNMAFLIKSIKLGREAYGMPEKERKHYTNFVRR